MSIEAFYDKLVERFSKAVEDDVNGTLNAVRTFNQNRATYLTGRTDGFNEAAKTAKEIRSQFVQFEKQEIGEDDGRKPLY